MSKEDLFADYLNDKRIKECKPTKVRKPSDYPDTINQISKKFNVSIYNLSIQELEQFIKANINIIKSVNYNGRWFHALKNYYNFLLNNNNKKN